MEDGDNKLIFHIAKLQAHHLTALYYTSASEGRRGSGTKPTDPVPPGMVAAHLHTRRKVVSAERVCCATSL